MTQLARADGSTTVRSEDDIHQGRRHDLTVAALHTWSEYGYSHVSVRNVARRTRFSHGMVHYYFRSKDALVAECVRMIHESDIFAADAADPTDVTSYSQAVADRVCDSLRTHRRMHRIRFDLRNQSQFEPELRRYADEIEHSHEAAEDAVRARYEQLGWSFDPPFELLAAQIDALRERAVRDNLLGDDLERTVSRMHDDLLLVLPRNR